MFPLISTNIMEKFTIAPKPITIIAYAKREGWISMKTAERKKNLQQK